MATLYVTEPGARIEKEYRRILVTKEDEVLLRTPISRVTHVVLVGNAGATTPALLALLDRGVTLTLMGRGGRLRGRLVPPLPRNVPLRQAQYERERDTGFSLSVGRAVVAGKLHNSRTLMMRLRRRHPDLPEAALLRLQQAQARVATVDTLATLRGVEGNAARAYFQWLRAALRADMRMDKRTRRPPTDPVNALLSLGYTLLNEALMTACEVVGLDPYVGFFHAEKYGRPALALDMVEEFRAPIVDSLVLTLVNKRMIKPKDFEPGKKGGVYLTRHGLRIFLREFADRLEVKTMHPAAGRRLSYRQWFEVQARNMAKTIQAETDVYRPFFWR